MRPLLLALCLIACSKSDPSSPPAAAKQASPSSATPAPPAQTVHVTADGHAVAMTSAVLVHRSDDVLILTVANNPLRCEDAVNGERFGVPTDDISFTAEIDSPILPDGTRPFVLSHVGIAQTPNAKIQIHGGVEPAPELQLAFSIDDAAAVDHWKHLEVDGIVKPTVCPRPAVAAPTHPSTAVLTIAGRPIAIASARWRGGKVELSSEPGGCATGGPSPRAWLAIEHEDWHLDGGWIGNGLGGSKGLHVAAGAHGSSAEGNTIALTLSGTSTIADYKIDLTGTIEALDCPAS